MAKKLAPNAQRSTDCDRIITQHTKWAMGAALIPVPVADFLTVSAIQTDMIRDICELYGVNYADGQLKNRLSMIVGWGVARITASLIKIIPGLGSIVGGVAESIAAGASTYAVGEIFQYHFESGGNMEDFNTDKAKEWYDEAYEKGKKWAKEWRAKLKNKSGQDISEDDDLDDDDNTQALQNLEELHSKGIISEKEYKKMKKCLNT